MGSQSSSYLMEMELREELENFGCSFISSSSLWYKCVSIMEVIISVMWEIWSGKEVANASHLFRDGYPAGDLVE